MIGVDVGGTFTDLVLQDAATGGIRVAKHPTTPAAPELGVLAAVDVRIANGRSSATAWQSMGQALMRVSARPFTWMVGSVSHFVVLTVNVIHVGSCESCSCWDTVLTISCEIATDLQ